MKMKMKNRSYRYDINRPRSRLDHKYNKHKKCLSMMMLICIKQHLSNILSSIYDKVSNTEFELKKALFIKKPVLAANMLIYMNTSTIGISKIPGLPHQVLLGPILFYIE